MKILPSVTRFTDQFIFLLPTLAITYAGQWCKPEGFSIAVGWLKWHVEFTWGRNIWK